MIWPLNLRGGSSLTAESFPSKSWRVQPIVDPGISGAKILPYYTKNELLCDDDTGRDTYVHIGQYTVENETGLVFLDPFP